MPEVVAAQQLTQALGALDYLVVAACLGILVFIAWAAGRRETNTQDFFLGGRRVPAVIACLSFVATEISAMTILAVPAMAYSENWLYLQMFIGSALSRILVAFLFIPVFYKYNCTTIYEFLGHRFGAGSRYAGSGFFFLTRILSASVRIFVPCLGISIILHWPLGMTVVAFLAVSILFIGFGGIKAVVWTGAFEALVFFAVGGAVMVFLLSSIHGGPAEAWRVYGEAGMRKAINWHFDIADFNTVWAASLNGLFVGLSVFGTDQELMQRLLTVKTRRSSQKALVGTIFAALPLLCLYLCIGTLLFVFFRQHPQVPLPEKADKVLSHFTVWVLPIGLKGLVLAAIILASIDAPLASLSSCFVTDFYRPLIRKNASERHYLWVSRIGVVCFGVVLALLALACEPIQEKSLWVAFQIVSITGGSTLGVFLLGVLTKRHSNLANIFAMCVSAMTMASLLFLSKWKLVPIGWSWLIVIGTVETFAIGYLLGPSMEFRPAPDTTPR